MSQLRLGLLFVVASPALAPAAEKWADDRLPVTSGLELWFDAARVSAAKPLQPGAKLDQWPDGSGNGRHLRQPDAARRPALLRAGDGWAVRFDGEDDHLRVTGLDRKLDAVTVFLVAAPHGNPGAFTAFCAANARDRRDYESGFCIDQGPWATRRSASSTSKAAGSAGPGAC